MGVHIGVHQYKSKWSLTPQILAVLSSSNGPGKTNNHSVYFTRIWDFTWRVSDCEELVGVTWRVSDCEELVGGQSQEMVGMIYKKVLKL